MSVKLSHSALSRYQMCPTSYRLHYIDKVRPDSTTGALLFGSALDLALNCLLLNEGDPYERFIQAFTYGEINKAQVHIPTCDKIAYANADYDADLLNENHYKKASEVITGAETFKFDEIKEKKDQYGFANLKTEEKQYYNYILWQCLCVKAELMMAAYKKKILPKIKKVLAIQEKIEVDNGSGDILTGFVDLIVDFDGYGVCVLDHKTSAREYKEDSVKSSSQLTQYFHLTKEKYNAKFAGFIVMKKTMAKKKKCSICKCSGEGSRARTCDSVVNDKRCGGDWLKTPKAEIQIIIDEVSERQEEIVMENIDTLTSCIKSGLFPRALDKCNDWYGQKCPFIALCTQNSMKGLVKNEM